MFYIYLAVQTKVLEHLLRNVESSSPLPFTGILERSTVSVL